MPYQLSWETNCAVFRYYGHVSSEDIVESNQRAYGDERFDALRWQLVFFDEAESFSFTEANIRLIAYMDAAAARSNPRITVLFVGASDMLRQVEAAYSTAQADPPWPVLVFESRQEAVDYIEQREP